MGAVSNSTGLAEPWLTRVKVLHLFVPVPLICTLKRQLLPGLYSRYRKKSQRKFLAVEDRGYC